MPSALSRHELISTPASAAAVFSASLPTEIREERFFVLPLDGNGKVLSAPILISVGHEDGMAQIDIATVFREALKAGAEEIIVAHNHPSGKLKPSKADLQLTAELRSRAEWLGLKFLDHIILCASNSAKGFDFISLAEVLP